MKERQEDQDFLRYRQKGDPEAMARVFDAVAPKLLLVAAHLTKDRADAEEFVEQSLLASDDVQQEDVYISESVQRGITSSAYDQGRYAPKVEIGMYQFHRMLAADLRNGTA